jgi:hypothetical protein
MKFLRISLKLFFLSFLLFNCGAKNSDSKLPYFLLALSNTATTVLTGEIPTTLVSAILYGSDGNPLVNARMDISTKTSANFLSRGSDSTVFTDADGLYEMNVADGELNISVTKSDGTALGSFSLTVKGETPPVVANSNSAFQTTEPKASKPTASGRESSPPVVQYLNSSHILSINQFMLPVIPKVSGGLPTNCSISPSLPSGLKIKSTNCTITGTPTAIASSTSYTINAENSSGSSTTNINISVIQPDPPSSLTYSINPYSYKVGEVISIQPTSSGGKMKFCKSTPSLEPLGLMLDPRDCSVKGIAKKVQGSTTHVVRGENAGGHTETNLYLEIRSISNQSVPALITLSSNYTFTQGIVIQNITPIPSGGVITQCSISPALPNGLSFNTSNCSISGTPLALQTSTEHKITPSNSTGTGNSTSITIAVVQKVEKPSLAYSGNPYLKTVGESLSTPILPSNSGGTISSCSIHPSLPGGFTFSESSCAISGTPINSQPPTPYAVVATNSGGISTPAILLLGVTSALQKPSISFGNGSLTLTEKGSSNTTNPLNSGGSINSCAISSALPSGLNFNESTCSITGSPNLSQSSTPYTITATNSAGSHSVTLNITVLQGIQKAVISYAGSPYIFTKGEQIAVTTPSRTGGEISSCEVSEALPQGLYLESNTCSLYGTPHTVQGSKNYTITAKNSAGNSSVLISITINQAVPKNLSYPNSPFVFTEGIEILPRYPFYVGSISSCEISPTLPQGLNLNLETCVLSGTPTEIRTFANYKIKAINSAGFTETTIGITVNKAPPSTPVYSDNLYLFTANTPIAEKVPSLSGSITNCTVQPDFPTGLLLNTGTCAISGSPTQVQEIKTYTITASNPSGSSSTKISIGVQISAPQNLSFGDSNLVLTQDIEMSPKIPTYTGSLQSCTITPDLPSGLSLSSSTCTIRGTPTNLLSTTQFKVTATNSGGSTTADISLTITKTAPTNLTFVSGSNVLGLFQNLPISPISPSFKGSITNCTSNPELPSGLQLSSVGCVISGTPTNLLPPTEFKITASNEVGSSNISSVFLKVEAYGTPPSITFTNSLLDVFVDAEIPKFVPINEGGPITGCSISPTLPSGILFDSKNCAISGKISAPFTSTSYTVTATNSLGNSSAILNIKADYATIVSMPYGILKTGQKISYAEGDDGFWQKGVERTFVPGKKEGLVWQKCADGLDPKTCAGTASTYTFSLDYCNNLNLEDRKWRLPQVYELLYILENNQISTSLFPNFPDKIFSPLNFSETYYSYGGYPTYYKAMFISKTGTQGFTNATYKNPSGNSGQGYYEMERLAMMCISGQIPTNTLQISNNTVISSLGLKWEKCDAKSSYCTSNTSTYYTWNEALNYCNSLTLEGKQWRVPNRNEFFTLLDMQGSNTIKNLEIGNYDFAPDENIYKLYSYTYDRNKNTYSYFSNQYWTSSTDPSDSSKAYSININHGIITSTLKSQTRLLRCATDN